MNEGYTQKLLPTEPRTSRGRFDRLMVPSACTVQPLTSKCLPHPALALTPTLPYLLDRRALASTDSEPVGANIQAKAPPSSNGAAARPHRSFLPVTVPM
jgi:hypothetical protein